METSELLATHYIEEFDLWFLDPALQPESVYTRLETIKREVRPVVMYPGLQPDSMGAESETDKRQDCIDN